MATLVVGAYLQAHPMSWLVSTLLTLGATMIDQKLFGPGDQTMEGSKLSDLELQSSAYGTAIPRVYGKYRVGGNIIWGTNYVEHRHESSSGGGGGKGGGGGGGSVTTVSYTYSTSVAIGIHDGLINGITRIWADGTDITGKFFTAPSVAISGNIQYRLKSTDAWTTAATSSWFNVTSVTGSSSITFTVVTRTTENFEKKFEVFYNGVSYGLYAVGEVITIGNFSCLLTKATTTVNMSYLNSGEWVNGMVSTVAVTIPASFYQPVLSDDIKANGYSVSGNGINATLYYGSETQVSDPFITSIESDKYIPANRGLAYIVLKDFDTSDYGNRVPNFTFEVVRKVDNIEAIIKEVTELSGLSLTDIDIISKAFAIDHVKGIQVTADNTYRSQLENLMKIYGFFACETDGVVKFRYKNDCEKYPISLEYFGSKEGNTAEDKLYDVTRAHDLELPRRMKVDYLSMDKDYESGTMDAIKPTAKGKSTASLSLSDTVLTDSEAKTLAEEKLYEAYARRSSFKGKLPIWWAFLNPGDILVGSLSGRQRQLQVSKATFAPPGVVSIEATDIGSNTYSRVNRSVDIDVPASIGTAPSEVTMYMLDIPHIPFDTTTSLGLYVMAAGKPFYGALLYETRDNGASWTTKAKIEAAATAGTTTTKLLLGEPDVWDEANSVTVQLITGELESRPGIDILNGYNSAVIGNEIVQFRNAELIAANTYKLSGLLRGRLGTEDQISNHAIGDRFILLDKTTIAIAPAPLSEWYSDRSYKIGPATLPYTDALYKDFTFANNARAYQPWSVCNVKGTRDASSNLTITWNRRDRSGGDWLEGSDIALSESYEKYDVDVIKNSTVVATLTVTTPTVTLTASQLSSWFGSIPSSVMIRVYQLSATRGRGIVKEVTI